MSHAANSPSRDGSHRPGTPVAARILQARAGSDSALGEVLETCRKYLLLVANRSLDSDLRPKGGASDLVQETFFEAKKDFGQFRGTTEEELFAWLTRILANRVQKQVRAFRDTKKRDVGRELALEESVAAQFAAGKSETPSAVVMARDERARVEKAMQQLPEDNRQVLMLRTWQQLPFEEIGRIMDRSPDAARKLWARAVERLGRELAELP